MSPEKKKKPTTKKQFDTQLKRWEQKTLQPVLKTAPQRQTDFKTLSDLTVKTLYTPGDLVQSDFFEQIGYPGEYPYTRGIHPTMYRSRLWTMRQFAGFGSAEDTNSRFKRLLAEGQTGLSTAFDLPTLYGYDTDDSLAISDFGQGGVACSSMKDMEVLFAGIPLDKTSVSMTINGPAATIWAMFIANADNQGIPRNMLRGTLQNDILKEFIAQNEQIFPPKPSMRLVTDTIEFALKELPGFNPISVSGYHIRERGSTAVQELAFTLSDGFAYLESCLERGLDVNKTASIMSFFFNSHNNFFEEIAKFRVARRIWAKDLRNIYGATDERALKLRFHTQTSGVSLYPHGLETNIVRVTLQALAAVLGGTQSLHTDAMDEAISLPSEKAATLALRTQQVIAYESGVTDTVDPFGGSYYLESLTNSMEEETRKYFATIRSFGNNMRDGVLNAINAGFQQWSIIEAAVQYQKELDEKKRIIVGVNEFREPEAQTLEFKINPESLDRQLKRLNTLRRERNNTNLNKTLAALKNACIENQNVMPYLIDAAKAYATLGEMTDTMKGVFGEAQRPD